MLASSGFWALITEKSKKKNAERSMLVGLGHDRIITLGMQYINRGYITNDEYENLKDYLYRPYIDLGGNGTATKIMNEIEKLPIKPIGDDDHARMGC